MSTKVMDGRGWAQVAFTFGGGCHARLTGEGRLYVGIEQGRASAFRLVGQLKTTLQGDPSLSDSEREDLLTDVQMVEQQLKKREPNRAGLAALLEPLSRVASIGGFIADLVRLLNP